MKNRKSIQIGFFLEKNTFKKVKNNHKQKGRNWTSLSDILCNFGYSFSSGSFQSWGARFQRLKGIFSKKKKEGFGFTINCEKAKTSQSFKHTKKIEKSFLNVQKNSLFLGRVFFFSFFFFFFSFLFLILWFDAKGPC